MRVSWNLFLCLVFFSIPALAQKKELLTKYGKISDQEMALTVYGNDPAAPAVVLFDKGHVTHRYIDNLGFVLEFERHVRIKIFHKAAYSLADVPIFFFNWQKVQDLKASSYNLEGGKLVETKLEKNNVFEERLTRSRMVKKMTIPAVREGSIIEYRYTVVDEGAVGIQDWMFQRVDVPTIWSEFEVSVPTFIQFRKMSQGWVPYSLAEEAQKKEIININYVERSSGYVVSSKAQNIRVDYMTNTMHFIQENVPALKPEPFIGSLKDYLSQINFDIQAVYETSVVPSGQSYSLVNNGFKERTNRWERLGEEMLEDAYNDILRSPKYTAEATAACVAGKTANPEKVAAIYAFVGKNYQSLDLDYIMMSQTMESLTKSHKGTPTDLNLLFINMLRQAKINAYPVMISTRQNGHIAPFRVTTESVNRVIAAVETEANTQTLIDLAGWPNPLGLLPTEDLNGEGLSLKSKESIAWMPVQNKVPVRKSVMGDFTLEPATGLSGSVTFSESGYGAVDARSKIREKDLQTFVSEQFKELIADGSATDLQFENADNWQEAGVKGTFNLSTSAFINFSGDKIYLTPALGFGPKENPFKNPERKFNIDLGVVNSQTYNFTFKIPAGYKVEEIPKSLKMAFGENALLFEYFMEVTPEQVKISIRQSIKKPVIAVDQYADLQQFFATLIAKMGEQVVLTKG